MDAVTSTVLRQALATAERLGAEVEVLRGLVGEPEFGSAHGQLSDYFTLLVVDPKQLGRSERGLVELNRSCPVSNGEHGNHRDLLISHHSVPSLATPHGLGFESLTPASSS
jgi:hypothetical protein